MKSHVLRKDIYIYIIYTYIIYSIYIYIYIFVFVFVYIVASYFDILFPYDMSPYLVVFPYAYIV